MSREEELRQIALEEIAQEELDQEEKGQVEAQAPTIDPEVGAALSSANPFMQPEIESIVPSDEERKAQGFGAMEGIPMAKDAFNATLTLAQGGTENFSERKRTNQRQWDDEYNRLKKRYPGTTLEADLVASTLFYGGTGALFPITTGIAGLGVMGGISAYSRTQDRDDTGQLATNVATGAALGAGIGVLAKYGPGLVQKGSEYVKRGAEKAAHEIRLLNRDAFKRMMGATNSNTSNKVINHAIRTNPKMPLEQVEKVTIERLGQYKTTDGIPLIGRNFSKTNAQAQILKKAKGEEIGKILGKMDDGFDKVSTDDLVEMAYNKAKLPDINPKNIEANAKIRHHIERSMLPPTKTNTIIKGVPKKTVSEQLLGPDGKKAVIDEIVDVTESTLTPAKYSATALQKAKLDAARNLKFDPKNGANITTEQSRAYEAIRDSADDILANTSPEYSKANLEWSDFNLIEDVSLEAFKLEGNVLGKVVNKVRDVGAFLSNSETAKSNITKSNAIIGGMKLLQEDPNVDIHTKAKAQKIANFVMVSPDSVYTKRMVMGAAMADQEINTTYQPMEDVFSGVAAELSLLETPIKRNINDIKMKSDLLLDAINYYDSDKADEFRSALQSEDDESVRIAMDQLSKMPELKDIFEDGKGIDGRVFSEEDKQQLKSEVDNMDVSYIQKLKHHKALDNQGLIPQVVEEPERFFQYQRRDKTKPNY